MPNWIEGTLKLRGGTNCLKKFFTEGIEPCYDNMTLNECVNYEWAEEKGWNEVSFKQVVWVKGTRRAFILPHYDAYWEAEHATIMIAVRQAWDFDTDSWAEIARTYHLDVRLYGFERGMQFCREIEVLDGTVTIDNEIKYDDWDWECPMPMIGG